MNRYLKLVNFEFNRFLIFYLVLIGITIIGQIIAVVGKAKQYMNQANNAIFTEGMSKIAFIDSYGTMSFINIYHNFWFIAPIMLCGATLVLYVFFIWYRDWFGKNTFSYRLFMVPTNRLNIYLAKLTTILLFTLGLVALQIILIVIGDQILKWMIPDEYLTEFSLMAISNYDELGILLPKSILGFLLTYGGGLVIVCVIFTAILLERSYRFIGILYGLLYGALSCFIFFIPMLFNAFIVVDYFYPLELFILEVIAAVMILAGAIWIGNYLLKHKIRV
ncbi:hypothetical protein [Bacillus sp. B1-b2]|uniref:hypothetical protein n=1 Tax=Bacillus sp. B1-b2 TaxID=2653201 RepID=UPI00126293BE|nr:hypothetical protein [Bacillus sp. B1-b2]KAB7667773.1 hypothetical protein F9279_14720 [Bacillus sp. B1-b2]